MLSDFSLLFIFLFLAALVRCAVFALCASTHLFAQHCPRVVAILSYDILPVEDIYYNFFFVVRTQSELWSDDCFEQVSCTSVRACVVCVCDAPESGRS